MFANRAALNKECVRRLVVKATNPPLIGEVRATAVVRSLEPGAGMGIEFAAMDPEPRALLLHLLRRQLGDPAE